MARSKCEGAGKQASSNVTGITGRCPVCGYEYRITKDGRVVNHREPLK